MRRPQEIFKQIHQVDTIVELTGVFEGIASMRISQIKNQVLQSKDFFQELWRIYSQIRVDRTFGYGRSTLEAEIIDKELLVVITAEGGFSGDIDQKLIDWLISNYDKEKHEIIVIGHHGAVMLAQRGISIKRYFKLPVKDKNINVIPIIEEVQKYKTTTAYYQTYVSLMVQDVKRISLMAAVQKAGQEAKVGTEIISEENYIFEPSTYAVIDHLERSMLTIALSQVILESKLAQYASRFRAMTNANDKAKENSADVHLAYNRSKRALADERLKEIINGMKKARA